MTNQQVIEIFTQAKVSSGVGEELDRITRQLRNELLDLDIESVKFMVEEKLDLGEIVTIRKGLQFGPVFLGFGEDLQDYALGGIFLFLACQYRLNVRRGSR